MKKMMLIPTRAGYVYECTNCSGRFDATTCEADNHGC